MRGGWKREFRGRASAHKAAVVWGGATSVLLHDLPAVTMAPLCPPMKYVCMKMMGPGCVCLGICGLFGFGVCVWGFVVVFSTPKKENGSPLHPSCLGYVQGPLRNNDRPSMYSVIVSFILRAELLIQFRCPLKQSPKAVKIKLITVCV